MLQTCIYLAAMGARGMRQVATLCRNKAHYAASLIAAIPGFSIETGEFFKEFTVRTPISAETLCERLLEKGVVAGYPMSRADSGPGAEKRLLVCVTELNSRAQIELLAQALKEAAR